MFTIAILDDGINSSCFPLLKHIKYSIAVTSEGIISKVCEPDKITHGTLCAAIIRLYAPDAELISVQVIDPVTLKGSIRQIRCALEWCISHDVSLINLSIGDVNFEDWVYLRPTITNLVRANIPLICACSNDEIPSIFTEFSWPISVERGEALWGNQYYPQEQNFLGSDFYASSTHMFITSEKVSKTFSSQNSHAAPVITAEVYRLFKEFGKLPTQRLRHLLQKKSTDNGFHIKLCPDFIDTAVMIGQPQYPQEFLTFSKTEGEKRDSPVFLAVFPNTSLDVELVKKEIISYKNKVLGLVYAGTATDDIKEIARQIGCLFWAESEYIGAAIRFPQQSDKSTAIKILFHGSSMLSIYLAQSLHEKLIVNGYRSKVFSDWPQAYCLGMIFWVMPIVASSYICSLANYYKLDIVLVCSDQVDLQFDMTISCEGNSILLRYDDSQKRYSTVEFSFDQIIKDILALLL